MHGKNNTIKLVYDHDYGNLFMKIGINIIFVNISKYEKHRDVICGYKTYNSYKTYNVLIGLYLVKNI